MKRLHVWLDVSFAVPGMRGKGKIQNVVGKIKNSSLTNFFFQGISGKLYLRRPCMLGSMSLDLESLTIRELALLSIIVKCYFILFWYFFLQHAFYDFVLPGVNIQLTL